jgi:hypothetical protein
MKSIILLMMTIFVSTLSFSQKKMPANPKLEAQIIALEKSGWNAWKNKDVAWYKANATEEFFQVFGDGILSKADVMKLTATECDVKSFSLADFKFVQLSADVAVLTYIATQDAVCGGKANTPKVRVSVNYVKRGGKWLEAFYMETPVIQ